MSNLPTVWMNVLAGYLLAQGRLWPPLISEGDILHGVEPSLLKLTLLVVGVSAMYCGGMVMNDCIDRDLDAVSRMERPLPSGRVTLKEGTLACLALFLSSLAVLTIGGGALTLAGALLLLALVVTYNLTHNSSPWSVVPMAGCRFMIYICVWLAVPVRLFALLLTLAVLQFVYIVLLSMIARLEKSGKATRMRWPPIPVLLAFIPVLDGAVVGCSLGAGWTAAGIAAGAATLALQGKVRGD